MSVPIIWAVCIAPYLPSVEYVPKVLEVYRGMYLFLHFEKEILSTHVFPPQFIIAHKGRQDEIIS